MTRLGSFREMTHEKWGVCDQINKSEGLISPPDHYNKANLPSVSPAFYLSRDTGSLQVEQSGVAPWEFVSEPVLQGQQTAQK